MDQPKPSARTIAENLSVAAHLLSEAAAAIEALPLKPKKQNLRAVPRHHVRRLAEPLNHVRLHVEPPLRVLRHVEPLHQPADAKLLLRLATILAQHLDVAAAC